MVCRHVYKMKWNCKEKEIVVNLLTEMQSSTFFLYSLVVVFTVGRYNIHYIYVYILVVDRPFHFRFGNESFYVIEMISNKS